MLGGTPFHAPRLTGDHISILSFNNIPLPDAIIEALVDHRELFADDFVVRWVQEQDLLFEATPGELRGRNHAA